MGTWYPNSTTTEQITGGSCANPDGPQHKDRPWCYVDYLTCKMEPAGVTDSSHELHWDYCPPPAPPPIQTSPPPPGVVPPQQPNVTPGVFVVPPGMTPPVVPEQLPQQQQQQPQPQQPPQQQAWGQPQGPGCFYPGCAGPYPGQHPAGDQPQPAPPPAARLVPAIVIPVVMLIVLVLAAVRFRKILWSKLGLKPALGLPVTSGQPGQGGGGHDTQSSSDGVTAKLVSPLGGGEDRDTAHAVTWADKPPGQHDYGYHHWSKVPGHLIAGASSAPLPSSGAGAGQQAIWSATASHGSSRSKGQPTGSSSSWGAVARAWGTGKVMSTGCPDKCVSDMVFGDVIVSHCLDMTISGG